MLKVLKNMYLLTKWEGQMRSVCAPWPRGKYFPIQPDLTLSIGILSHDQFGDKYG